MRRRTVIILGIIAATALAVTAKYYWDVHRRNQRQKQYEATLASYSSEIRLGTHRAEVESILHSKGVTLSHEPYGGPPLDDFTKIGREQDLVYCSWENVDIQFHFEPSKPASVEPLANDTLRKIALGQWPYDCL
jgi:hypothetical protein